MQEGETKQAILDSAERLFGEAGYHGASMREITRSASVNLAAVNYHFGSKKDLLAAVLARRLEPLNKQRLDRLEAILKNAPNGILELEEILRGFIEPVFSLMRKQSRSASFIALIGRAFSDPSNEIFENFKTLVFPVGRRYEEVICSALPKINPQIVAIRWMFSIGCMAHTLLFMTKFCQLEPPFQLPLDKPLILEELISFTAAGLRGGFPDNRGRAEQAFSSAVHSIGGVGTNR